MSRSVITNPITELVQSSVRDSSDCIHIAVPFISAFVRSVLTEKNTKSVRSKRIITRFDDSYINSFDLPSLELLLEMGFTIKYDNEIHMKLYITDSEAYVTSSNLTRGGFEENKELTVRIGPGDTESMERCKAVFQELWKGCGNRYVTKKLIADNMEKYKVLNKRSGMLRKGKKELKYDTIKLDFDLDSIIEAIFNEQKDHTEILKKEYEANRKREKVKNVLLAKGFNTNMFYAPENHPLRKKTLFYDFIYGNESKLAGTGLREAQCKAAFLDKNFPDAIRYILPEMLEMRAWNFQDREEMKEFCNGLFEFDIPSYHESLPIRLASYFYPDYFLPIFKLDHLKNICISLGLKTNAKTMGERLYVYNSFLEDKMRALPVKNIIRSYMAYQIQYTVDLFHRLKSKETLDEILKGCSKKWIRDYYKKGYTLLSEIGKTNK